MRQGLIACITCELLALAVWIGGLIVLVAAVIPAVFNTFGGQDTGGFFLTRAFDGYNRLVLGAATVLTLGILWRAWLVQQGQADGEISRTEWLLLGGMLLTAGVITFVLHPQAAALQAQAFASKGEEAKEGGFRSILSDAQTGAGSVYHECGARHCAADRARASVDPSVRSDGEESDSCARRWHVVRRAGIGGRRRDRRRSRVQHGHDRLSGSVDRSFLSRTDRDHDLSAYRKLRCDPGRYRVASHVGGGVRVKESSRVASNWRSQATLQEYLQAANIVGIEGVDTRALTTHLREKGAQPGVISHIDLDPHRLAEKARQAPSIIGRDLAAMVTLRTQLPLDDRNSEIGRPNWRCPTPPPLARLRESGARWRTILESNRIFCGDWSMSGAT